LIFIHILEQSRAPLLLKPSQNSTQSNIDNRITELIGIQVLILFQTQSKHFYTITRSSNFCVEALLYLHPVRNEIVQKGVYIFSYVLN